MKNKATGIVRRMDDLGRVVIPKEIRKHLRIREGDRMEVFVDDNQQVILKKHDLAPGFEITFESVAATLQHKLKNSIIICSTEKVLAVSGKSGKSHYQKPIADKLLAMLEKRSTKEGENIEIIKDHQINSPYALIPLNAFGDLYGGIIIIGDARKIDATDIAIVETTASLLAAHFE